MNILKNSFKVCSNLSLKTKSPIYQLYSISLPKRELYFGFCTYSDRTTTIIDQLMDKNLQISQRISFQTQLERTLGDLYSSNAESQLSNSHENQQTLMEDQVRKNGKQTCDEAVTKIKSIQWMREEGQQLKTNLLKKNCELYIQLGYPKEALQLYCEFDGFGLPPREKVLFLDNLQRCCQREENLETEVEVLMEFLNAHAENTQNSKTHRIMKLKQCDERMKELQEQIHASHQQRMKRINRVQKILLDIKLK